MDAAPVTSSLAPEATEKATTRARRALAGRRVRYSAALAFFVAATLLWLLPLSAHLGTRVLGTAGDATSALRETWAAGQQGENPFTLRHDYLLGAPEGLPQSTSITLANAAQPLFIWVLGSLVGNVVAWNVLLIAGFALAGFAMFVLLDRLGLHVLAALFGGYAFAFSSYEFEQAFLGHAGLVQIWIFPLLLMALLHLRQARSLSSAALVGLILASAFYLTSYFALFGIFLVTLFMAVDLVGARGTQRLRSFTLFGASLAITLTLFSPALVAWLRDRESVSAFVSRPLSDLQKGGASMLEYLAPSGSHHLLGAAVHPGDRTSFPVEHTIFLGYTTMALALGAAFLIVRGHGSRPLCPGYGFLVRFSLALIPAAFVMSLPRFVHPFGIALPAPSYLIGNVTTYWRVYARFGLFVSLGLIVLAAVALDALVRRKRGLPAGLALLVAAALELAPGPPIETFATSPRPPYATWLAQRPGGIVADYPLIGVRASFDAYRETYAYEQVAHGHPLFERNVSIPIATREEAFRLLARDLTDPLTARILAAEGVRYVVVHDDAYRNQGLEHVNPPRRTYAEVASFPGTRIFRVHAPRANLDRVVAASIYLIPEIEGVPTPHAAFGAGFHPPERFKDGRLWRWMVQGGRIEVEAPASVSPVRFTAFAFSAHRARTVQLLDPRGRILASAVVGTALTRLVLGPFALPAGHTELRLRVLPGPEELGGGDTRVASVFISPFQLRPIADLSRSLRAP